jgi:MYXO-CTERM domain-containing protein
MGFQLFDSAGSPVPEPSTGMLGMLALGGFALIRGLRH